ncbi:MAG TPA: ABC transporter permease [Vicinamibacterales bacterium]
MPMTTLVDAMLQDVRYALRGLRRQPAFAAVAIATLAVGIGGGTTVFSFVRAILLRPLPYAEPSQLVRIFETNPLRGWTRNIAAPANWADWRTRNHAFSGIAAYEQFNANGSGASDVFLTGFGEPQGLKSLGVSGDFFDVLGVRPLMGRTFSEDEMYDGKSRVAVLSFGLWQSVFGGDPQTVGRTITLSGRAYDVVGVMPRGFFFPGRDVQLWLPFGYTPDLIARSRRPHWLGVVGRLRPDVSVERASEEMIAIARQLESEYPDTNTQMSVSLEPFRDSLVGSARTPMLMLGGAVGLLFLIVCGNLANLQLGRVLGRSRELAIRQALGAARGRLVRQLATESAVLAFAGGALGVGLAATGQAALTRFAASAVPLFADVQTDRSVLLFAVVLSIAAPILFGVMPLRLSSHQTHLSEKAPSATRNASTLRSVLVAGEVALSIVLVVGAVLLVRSLNRLQDVDPGFDRDDAVAFTLSLPAARYPDAPKRFLAAQEIERRLRDAPGIQAVGATSTLALRGMTWSGDATIEGRAPADFERELQHMATTEGYFRAMRTRLLAGRFFEQGDTRDKPPVAIVNETLARRYFRNLSPADVIGRRITFGRPTDQSPWNTIVGVVADERQNGLDKPVGPTAYSPLAQLMQNPLTFVLRSPEPPDALVALARRTVSGVDKDLALTDVTTLDDLVDGAMEGHRFRTALLAAFAAMALFLAALGLYGVLTYFVSQRLRELGIRLALGATPAELCRMVVGQGMRPVVSGGILGLVAAIGSTRLIQSLLFGVEPLDPVTFATAGLALALTAFAACAIPAIRATRVDPIVALREE